MNASRDKTTVRPGTSFGASSLQSPFCELRPGTVTCAWFRFGDGLLSFIWAIVSAKQAQMSRLLPRRLVGRERYLGTLALPFTFGGAGGWGHFSRKTGLCVGDQALTKVGTLIPTGPSSVFLAGEDNSGTVMYHRVAFGIR
jgi:hypothetical protein